VLSRDGHDVAQSLARPRSMAIVAIANEAERILIPYIDPFIDTHSHLINIRGQYGHEFDRRFFALYTDHGG